MRPGLLGAGPSGSASFVPDAKMNKFNSWLIGLVIFSLFLPSVLATTTTEPPTTTTTTSTTTTTLDPYAPVEVPAEYGTMSFIFDGVLMVIGGLIHGVTLQSTTIGSAMGMTIALGMLAALVGSVVTVFAALIALAYISRDKGKGKKKG